VKRIAALAAVGLLALMVQGALTLFVPARWIPDAGLLVVVAAALWLRSAAGGLVVAALLGYATDLLSGSLLGQYVLLRIAAYGAARFASRRLNLRGPLPLALFGALLSLADAAALGALSSFVAAAEGSRIAGLGALLPRAFANGLAAPAVAAGARRLLAWAGEDEGGQRSVRLIPRKFAS
jgi:cell shape-determining protein MreD